MTVQASMATDSTFISPMIDTVKADALVIRNLVDYPQIVYNEFFNNGLSRTKYVSNIITLAQGQDAQDIQVILSAHRPPGTDIKVYVKFLNSQDPDPISAKTWTPLYNQSEGLYSDPSNPRDMEEFTYSTYSYYNLVQTSGTITVPSGCTVITGTSTYFGQEVGAGYYINMQANSTFNESARQVVSVTNTTSMIINAPFNASAGYTANAYYVVVPPTTAWMSATSNTQLTGFVNTSTTNNTITGISYAFAANTTNVSSVSNSIFITSANTYLTPGTPVFYYVPTGNTAVPGLVGNSTY
jgi:hypothetical protein